MKWRKINRIIHRDLGYFFFGMTLIYSLSGIALNHLDDWNPSYTITQKEIQVDPLPSHEEIDKEFAMNLAGEFDDKDHFKNYYFPEEQTLKIFIDDGSIEVNLKTGKGQIEKSERRPIFYEVNYLHYNPARLWTWFSDIFAIALILISISGLFILRGKKGITGRGAWLTLAGIVIPLLFLVFYL